MTRLLRSERRLRLPDGSEAGIVEVRDARARRLKLMVSERGPRLTVPRGVSELEIAQFLEQHRGWLAQQLRALQPPAALPVHAGEEAEPASPSRPASLLLRGARLPIERIESRRLAAVAQDQRIELHLPPRYTPLQLQRVLADFLLAEARRDLGQWLPHYLPTLPGPPRSIRLRPLSSLWGSLNAAGAVSLDLALVQAPPRVFEYVLVHELCHLLQRNHSPAYWAEVRARMPDHLQQRAWLKQHGLGLKAQLRQLLALQT
ncbi:MAG: M48 family metallopeptidase [Aquimonas sp.]|nr:M48 family metallopeptidase [Aquimonas sp.]